MTLCGGELGAEGEVTSRLSHQEGGDRLCGSCLPDGGRGPSVGKQARQAVTVQPGDLELTAQKGWRPPGVRGWQERSCFHSLQLSVCAEHSRADSLCR